MVTDNLSLDKKEYKIQFSNNPYNQPFLRYCNKLISENIKLNKEKTNLILILFVYFLEHGTIVQSISFTMSRQIIFDLQTIK